MTALDFLRSAERNARPQVYRHHLLRDFDSLFRSFDDLVKTSDLRETRAWQPAFEVKETESDFVLSFDLPGVKRDDISIEVQQNRLVIVGERKSDEKAEGQKYRFKKHYGKFQQVMTLPEGVDEQNIEASYEDGVLYLAIPKSAQSKPHKVKINSGKNGILSRLIDRTKENKDTAISA